MMYATSGIMTERIIRVLVLITVVTITTTYIWSAEDLNQTAKKIYFGRTSTPGDQLYETDSDSRVTTTNGLICRFNYVQQENICLPLCSKGQWHKDPLRGF